MGTGALSPLLSTEVGDTAAQCVTGWFGGTV